MKPERLVVMAALAVNAAPGERRLARVELNPIAALREAEDVRSEAGVISLHGPHTASLVQKAVTCAGDIVSSRMTGVHPWRQSPGDRMPPFLLAPWVQNGWLGNQVETWREGGEPSQARRPARARLLDGSVNRWRRWRLGVPAGAAGAGAGA